MRIAIAPFFLQGLRGDARSGKTYLVRAVMAAFLLFVLASVHDSWRYMSAPGLNLFSGIVCCRSLGDPLGCLQTIRSFGWIDSYLGGDER